MEKRNVMQNRCRDHAEGLTSTGGHLRWVPQRMSCVQGCPTEPATMRGLLLLCGPGCGDSLCGKL